MRRRNRALVLRDEPANPAKQGIRRLAGVGQRMDPDATIGVTEYEFLVAEVGPPPGPPGLARSGPGARNGAGRRRSGRRRGSVALDGGRP